MDPSASVCIRGRIRANLGLTCENFGPWEDYSTGRGHGCTRIERYGPSIFLKFITTAASPARSVFQRQAFRERFVPRRRPSRDFPPLRCKRLHDRIPPTDDFFGTAIAAPDARSLCVADESAQPISSECSVRPAPSSPSCNGASTTFLVNSSAWLRVVKAERGAK